MHDVANPVSTEDRVRPRRGAMGVAIGGLGALVIVLVGIKVMQIAKMMSSPMQMPATTVTSATAKEEEWAPVLPAVGSVSAGQGAVPSTELAGRVAEANLESGSVENKA